MPLPTGLIPVFIFVVTVGISVPVTLTAYLMYRNGIQSLASAVRIALLEAGLLYLVGVLVVWAITGGGLNIDLWEIPVSLVVIGIGVLIVLTAIPLIIGQNLINHFMKVDSETALQYAMYGWPVATLAVFGIFITPGGLTHGHLFHLEGAQICLVGFCGIIAPFAAAVLLEAFIAVFGPGLIGLLLVSHRRAGHRFLPGP